MKLRFFKNKLRFSTIPKPKRSIPEKIIVGIFGFIGVASSFRLKKKKSCFFFLSPKKKKVYSWI